MGEGGGECSNVMAFPGDFFPLPSEEEKEGDGLPDPAGSEEEEEEEEEEEDPILAWRASGAAAIGLGRGKRGDRKCHPPSFVRTCDCEGGYVRASRGVVL